MNIVSITPIPEEPIFHISKRQRDALVRESLDLVQAEEERQGREERFFHMREKFKLLLLDMVVTRGRWLQLKNSYDEIVGKAVLISPRLRWVER